MIQILINHMGYSSSAPKKAVLQVSGGETPTAFSVRKRDGTSVLEGRPVRCGSVAHWNTGDYWTITFTPLEAEGRYRIALEAQNAAGQKASYVSEEFEIRQYHTTMRLINAAAYYFKAQRDAGVWLAADRNLPFAGPREGRRDVHGGWFDATGDYGIHLSHLSHSTYYNPQQVPLAAYVFFQLYERIRARGGRQYSMIGQRVLDEGIWGADFLMRMRAPSGAFLRSINRTEALDPVLPTRHIGFEYFHSSDQFTDKAATAEEETITDVNYETSLRCGGGMAIAALACGARHPYPGQEFSSAEYLEAAEWAWAHLYANDEKYTNDGRRNLIDDMCGLMAVTELYRSTGNETYLAQARSLADQMGERAGDAGVGMKRLYVDEDLVFCHASDEGLPVAALLKYAAVESDPAAQEKARGLAEALMRRLFAQSDGVNNPFGYPVLENGRGDHPKVQFFFPHDTTAAPWWQGDNARIASLGTAAAMLGEVTEDVHLAARCRQMAEDAEDWILGLNPFDSCMMEGYGRNNIQYYFNGRSDFMNCPGGIVNGITSREDDEEGIEFVMEPDEQITDNWRWAEQWIPHAAWFLALMGMKIS